MEKTTKARKVSRSAKKGLKISSELLKERLNQLPFITRRTAAWAIEISLVAASAIIPYTIGAYVTDVSAVETVPLNSVLAETEEAIGKTLALPLRDRQRQVAPLTNLLWWGALILPVGVAGWQLHHLRKTGQTPPKRWFGVRVVKPFGEPPDVGNIFRREAIGRWGLPVGTAYIIWRYAGGFPDLGILLGLSGVMILAEVVSFLFDPQRLTLHDRLAGTIVLKAGPSTLYAERFQKAESPPPKEPVTLEVQTSARELDKQGELAPQPSEKVTKIVVTPLPGLQRLRLVDSMRENPGLTLLVVTCVGMTAILGTFVGTQIYIQSQANRREFNQQNNEMYLALVKQLSDTSLDAPEERRGAILALATLKDKDARAIPFLVNLLGQEKNQELIEAIEQAVVDTGPLALPHLQRLNQSLTNDREALRRQGSESERELNALQLKATQQAIGKILTIYTGQIHDADLSRTDLGNTSALAPFTLVLDKIDLSGINFKGANLRNASLQGSRFYGAGDDEHFDTFDDWIANLSGTDLKGADLTGASLSYVLMNRTNLVQANLTRSNLSNASMTGANLSSAQLAHADLRQTILENAILTGANLAEANFNQSNLRGARLGKAIAVGAQFAHARLSQTNWQEADLSTANLRQANLQNADLSFAKLVGTNLRNARLQNANFQNADLSQADLRGANVAGADFSGATFAASQSSDSDEFVQSAPTAEFGAQVKGVNFTQAINLDPKQLVNLCNLGARHPQCR